MKRHILIVATGFSGIESALHTQAALGLHDCADVQVSVMIPQSEPRRSPHALDASALALKAQLSELFDAAQIRFIYGTVEGIDTVSKRVEYSMARGIHSWLTYDTLVIAPR